MKAASLTPKRARFVAEYLVDLNAAQAAIRAGYSRRTARQQAARLLTNTDIASALTKGKAAQLQGLDVDAKRVLRELGRLAVADLRRCFDEQGNLRPVADLPDDVAAAVASVEVVRRPTAKGQEPEFVHKLKLWDKVAALGLLARHYALLVDRVEASVTTTPARIDLSRLSREERVRYRQLVELQVAGGSLSREQARELVTLRARTRVTAEP